MSDLKWINDSAFELGESYDLLKQYNSNIVDLVVTSPPYFNQRVEYAEYKDLNDYLDQIGAALNECQRLLRHSHIMAVNIGQDREVDLPAYVSMLLQNMGLKYIDTICWDKNSEIGMRGNFLNSQMYYPNFRWEPILIYQKPPLVTVVGKPMSEEDFPKFAMEDTPFISSVLRTNLWQVTPERNSWHPAPYPEQLVEFIIRCYTKPRQVVLDPYGGSGTTAVVAERLHRKYLTFERNREYYDKAIQRIKSQNLTLGL